MSDLISREAALDIVFDFAKTPHRMYQQIRELPTIEAIDPSVYLEAVAAAEQRGYNKGLIDGALNVWW